jgi:TRAP-type C4-dicarboxylate transport system substrate-binding protein
MKWFKTIAACLVASCSLPVAAQGLPATQLKVIGGLSTRAMYKDIEQPFWTDTIPKKSNGQVTAEIKAFDEMGLKGPDLFRLMKQGLVEFGVVPLSYSATEYPIFEAPDLAGLATDEKSARGLAQSFMPVLSNTLETTQQVKLLGVSPFGAQVLFCNVPIRGLQDLRGKTVRTVTRSQADLMEALGARSTTVSSGEVLDALKKKKLACAVAVPMTAYQAKWYTAATYIYALPVGWNQEVHAVNQKTWDQLDPGVQQFLQTNITELTTKLWAFSAAQTQLAYDCLTGNRACTLNPKGKMVLVKPTASDLALVKKIAAQKVANRWAARCSAQCVADFNRSIGQSLKITVKK